MDGQELIQVNFQLPASALDGLSRLAEQLRLLAEAFQGRTEAPGEPVREQGGNAAFDWARFQAMGLERGLPDPAVPTESAAQTDLPAPHKPRDAVSEELRQPAAAARAVGKIMEDPPQAGSPSGGTGEAETAALPGLQTPGDAQSAQAAVSAVPADAPAAGPGAANHPPSPRSAGGDAESPIPAAQSAGAPEPARYDPPASARTEMSMDGTAPIQAEPAPAASPETPQSRWGGGALEFSPPAPPPLTAESVSQAFQRDGRRYDGGFPLY